MPSKSNSLPQFPVPPKAGNFFDRTGNSFAGTGNSPSLIGFNRRFRALALLRQNSATASSGLGVGAAGKTTGAISRSRNGFIYIIIILIRQAVLNEKHLLHLVAEVVDDLDADAAMFRLGERA